MAFGELTEEYLGQWAPFVYDREKNVQVWLRIRPLTPDENDRIEQKYGKYKFNKHQGVRQLQIPRKNQRQAGLERFLYMWTGIRNGYIGLPNERSVAFLAECLNTNKAFKVGAQVLLPEDLYDDVGPNENVGPNDKKAPRPFDRLKTRMLQQDMRLSKKISEIGFGTDEDADEDDGADGAGGADNQTDGKKKQEGELAKN